MPRRWQPPASQTGPEPPSFPPSTGPATPVTAGCWYPAMADPRWHNRRIRVLRDCFAPRSPRFSFALSFAFRALLSFPPRKRGPRGRGGAVATERTSAQWAFRWNDARGFLKEQHPPCCGGRGGSMPFWPLPSARWSLDPGFRRENDERDRHMKVGFPCESGGPEAAVVRWPRSGPQRSGLSAGTMSGFCRRDGTFCTTRDKNGHRGLALSARSVWRKGCVLASFSALNFPSRIDSLSLSRVICITLWWAVP